MNTFILIEFDRFFPIKNHTHTRTYIYIYIHITERDVMEAPFVRCLEKVPNKHLWSLHHQMPIVLMIFVIFLIVWLII
jgi:hypothetical protein